MIRDALWYYAHRLRGHRPWRSRWVGWCADCGAVRQLRNPLTDPEWQRQYDEARR